jgi:hypothetical protein
MARHLSREHKLPGSNPSYDALYRDAKLQTWLPRNRAKYWEVVTLPSDILPAPPAAHPRSKFLEDIHRREEMYWATADHERLKDTGLQSFVSTSPWMNHTQWAARYQGARRDILVNITKIRACSLGRELPVGRYDGDDLVSPEEDERKVAMLIAAMDRAFDRCEETLRRTGRPILCWLHTYHGTRFYPKPFKLLFREASRQKYRRLWKKFIVFIFRAYRMVRQRRKAVLRIRFTKEQLKQLKIVWTDPSLDVDARYDRYCECGPAAGNEQGYSSSSDEEEEEEEITEEEEEGEGEDLGAESEDHPETANVKVDPLAELVFRLSIFFTREEFIDGDPGSSLLVYFSGALGIREDGLTFRRAKEFTPIVAGLIYVQRLLFLEYALPHRNYVHVGYERRPKRNHLERLNLVRLRYMVLGSMSPLGEFLSLLHCGRKLARQDPPTFFVRWGLDDQTLHYHNTSITMDEFHVLTHRVVKVAGDLCKELMYDWLPQVDLHQVKDDLRNRKAGFSFVRHPDNHLSEAYFSLPTKACTAELNGLMTHGTWDRLAVVQYLVKKETFLMTLLATMYITGGQAPRGSEISV